jgi:hypothetical protein
MCPLNTLQREIEEEKKMKAEMEAVIEKARKQEEEEARAEAVCCFAVAGFEC